VNEDTPLIDGLRSNQPQAWEALVSDYGDLLLRMAYRTCDNEEQAREWVQETFVRCTHSIDRYRGECALGTWLVSILRNVMRASRRRTPWLSFVSDVPEAQACDPGDHQVSDFHQLEEALLLLSSEHREVLILRYFENRSLADIAHHTGTALGTVKSRLHYAQEHLRGLLSIGSFNGE
jgi:RNA polymerase sigma-70 factor (ECF subfamily)